MTLFMYYGALEIVGAITITIIKATNFKFCTHIRRIDRNKSPLKISTLVG